MDVRHAETYNDQKRTYADVVRSQQKVNGLKNKGIKKDILKNDS